MSITYPELMVGSSIVAEGNLHSFFEESGVIHNAVVFDGINTALPDYPSKDVFAYYCPVCKKLKFIEPYKKNICETCKCILNEKSVNKYQSEISKFQRIFYSTPKLKDNTYIIEVYVLQGKDLNYAGDVQCLKVQLNRKKLGKLFDTNIQGTLGKYVVNYMLNSEIPYKCKEYRESMIQMFKSMYSDVFNNVDNSTMNALVKNTKEIVEYLQRISITDSKSSMMSAYEKAIANILNEISYDELFKLANRLKGIGVNEKDLKCVCELYGNVKKYTSYNIDISTILINDMACFQKSPVAPFTDIVKQANQYVVQQKDIDCNAGMTVILFMEQFIKATNNVEDEDLLNELKAILSTADFREFTGKANKIKDEVKEYKLRNIQKSLALIYKDSKDYFDCNEFAYTFKLLGSQEIRRLCNNHQSKAFETMASSADDIKSRKVVPIVVSGRYIALYDSKNDDFKTIISLESESSVSDVRILSSLNQYKKKALKTAIMLTNVFQPL